MIRNNLNYWDPRYQYLLKNFNIHPIWKFLKYSHNFDSSDNSNNILCNNNTNNNSNFNTLHFKTDNNSNDNNSNDNNSNDNNSNDNNSNDNNSNDNNSNDNNSNDNSTYSTIYIDNLIVGPNIYLDFEHDYQDDNGNILKSKGESKKLTLQQQRQLNNWIKINMFEHCINKTIYVNYKYQKVKEI